MKVRLLHPDTDPDLTADLAPDLAQVAADLTRDLGLEALVEQMAAGDERLRGLAGRLLLSPVTHPAVIGYRQGVLQDFLEQPDLAERLYQLAVEAVGVPRRARSWMLSRDPDGVLHRAADELELLLPLLRQLRQLADEHVERCASPGLRTMLATVEDELPDDYFSVVADHLERLRFPTGLTMTASLNTSLQGSGYVIRKPARLHRDWKAVLLGTEAASYAYRVPDRDEAGAQALAALQNQGLNLVANAVAQSVEHILGFFTRLRDQTGSYLGAVHLHHALRERGLPTGWPEPAPPLDRALTAYGLYDISLALRLGTQTVGNDLAADGATLVMITGTNQGGKSTVLRALGIAQLMLQAGLFVPATGYRASLATTLRTHYRREEDADLAHGKLDEELARMSGLVDQLRPASVLLCNESFAATNDREGSQIARQLVDGLRGAGIRVFYVTHLYDLASGLAAADDPTALFLHPERLESTERTYRVVPGAPEPTSHGLDLYARVFGEDADQAEASEPGATLTGAA